MTNYCQSLEKKLINGKMITQQLITIMNLYEEITKQGYKIEKMRSHSNNNRVYIINESNERIGYYSKMEGTRTKIILKRNLF
ncbi:hypothetical protein HG619_24510 [Pseudomonas syringae]|nr:hypothetical protein [Pseudomonas syringae]